MPEWLIDFWAKNSGGIITGLIVAVPTVLLTRLATPNPDRRRWRHRTRLERLRAKLRRHERRLENPTKEIADVLQFVFRQTALMLALAVIALSSYLTTGRVDIAVTWVFLFGLANCASVFVEAAIDFRRLASPEKRRKDLELRIKRLEERGF